MSRSSFGVPSGQGRGLRDGHALRLGSRRARLRRRVAATFSWGLLGFAPSELSLVSWKGLGFCFPSDLFVHGEKHFFALLLLRKGVGVARGVGAIAIEFPAPSKREFRGTATTSPLSHNAFPLLIPPAALFPSLRLPPSAALIIVFFFVLSRRPCRLCVASLRCPTPPES